MCNSYIYTPYSAECWRGETFGEIILHVYLEGKTLANSVSFQIYYQWKNFGELMDNHKIRHCNVFLSQHNYGITINRYCQAEIWLCLGVVHTNY